MPRTVMSQVRMLMRETGASALDDFCQYTAAELLMIRGIGPTTIVEVRRRLARAGMALSGESPSPGRRSSQQILPRPGSFATRRNIPFGRFQAPRDRFQAPRDNTNTTSLDRRRLQAQRNEQRRQDETFRTAVDEPKQKRSKKVSSTVRYIIYSWEAGKEVKVESTSPNVTMATTRRAGLFWMCIHGREIPQQILDKVPGLGYWIWEGTPQHDSDLSKGSYRKPTEKEWKAIREGKWPKWDTPNKGPKATPSLWDHLTEDEDGTS